MSAQTASGPTEDQLEILEYNFKKVNKHPDPTTLCLIAAEAGLTEEETQVSPQAYCILGDWRDSITCIPVLKSLRSSLSARSTSTQPYPTTILFLGFHCLPEPPAPCFLLL
ncbi:homeodomain-only protein isoform X1 [Grammomys surdaster]|uniref:homeodomain-only protein isoform X1 n=1 Tax=Grammomys surdaster TaxID=491861 RepID=UPI00109F6269|nr:homeodomain-only protein isoform X1 [Grammomys surdaster]XP_028636596.1 homeodomain-only protein isoform X1 [Grammomys surdaster]